MRPEAWYDPSAGETPEPAVGDQLGPYRLEAVAGEGGMGRVFLATHVKLGRTVALKLLARRYTAQPKAVERFFHEARAANVIHHPNIVAITDIVEGPPGGDSYYIMEWLDGSDLANRLVAQGTLPYEEVVRFGRQIASALAAVHQAGFVHRDVKPENIFVAELPTGGSSIRLIDFGVASAPHADEGLVAGTPVYFSPECAAGHGVDARSDIYSLGVVLYELLSGSPPFQGATLAEYVMKHMTEKPFPLEAVVPTPIPQELTDLVDKCLRKEPGERYQSMAELEAALAQIAKLAPHDRRRRVWPIAVGVLAVATAGLVAFAVAVGKRPPPAATSPAAQLVSPPRPPPPSPAESPARPLAAAAPPASAPPPPPPATSALASPPPAPLPPSDPANAASRIAELAPPSPTAVAPEPDPRVEVEFDSAPGRVTVRVGGVDLCQTPCTARLPGGPVEVDFRRTGYKPTTRTVNARYAAKVEVKLLRDRSGEVDPEKTVNPFQ